MAMDIKLERALIRTYRKLREKPTLTNAEIAGLFVNFYYAETNTHGGLDTRGFTIVRKENIICIALSSRSSYFEQSSSLYDQLLDLKPADFYALWLRASFEDPNNDGYGSPELKGVLNVSQFIKDLEHPYTNYLNKTKTVI